MQNECFLGTNKYTGNIENGKPHGKGELVSAEGEFIYEGEWFNGLYQGTGKL
jgi:hypothetical protein